MIVNHPRVKVNSSGNRFTFTEFTINILRQLRANYLKTWCVFSVEFNRIKVFGMSTFNKLWKSKLLRFVWIGDRALFTKKQLGQSMFSAMNQVWQAFLSVAAGEDELRIWQTSDNDGNTRWHGCDRATGRSTCVATDDEMRAWIDRRYCQ